MNNRGANFDATRRGERGGSRGIMVNASLTTRLIVYLALTMVGRSVAPASVRQSAGHAVKGSTEGVGCRWAGRQAMRDRCRCRGVGLVPGALCWGADAREECQHGGAGDKGLEAVPHGESLKHVCLLRFYANKDRVARGFDQRLTRRLVTGGLGVRSRACLVPGVSDSAIPMNGAAHPATRRGASSAPAQACGRS